MSLFASLVPYGWNDRWAALFVTELDDGSIGDHAAFPGRVVRHDGVAVSLITPDGPAQVPVRGTVDPRPVVGDWVVVSSGAVARTLARSSLLRRREAGRDAEQPLVANVDMVLAVCGLDRPVKPGRIHRAVTLAWDAGAVPVVVLAKADVRDPADAAAEADSAAAAAPGTDVIVTSAITGEGLDRLCELAVDRTIVLIGESGAGKSSLANALTGQSVAATAAVRSGDAKGRHTTTTRQMHLLPSGGVLVDTPGLRAVGLWADTEAVDAAFDDVEALAAGCRFNDCKHAGEPGCAVTAAVDDGGLPRERLDAWVALSREAESAARRADERARRAYERQFGRAAKEAVRRKRGRQPG
ncbi:MAG: ribosome small subunit-dependent GTPase A [Acidimicrobiales bacterium]